MWCVYGMHMHKCVNDIDKLSFVCVPPIGQIECIHVTFKQALR